MAAADAPSQGVKSRAEARACAACAKPPRLWTSGSAEASRHPEFLLGNSQDAPECTGRRNAAILRRAIAKGPKVPPEVSESILSDFGCSSAFARNIVEVRATFLDKPGGGDEQDVYTLLVMTLGAISPPLTLDGSSAAHPPHRSVRRLPTLLCRRGAVSGSPPVRPALRTAVPG